MKVEILNQGKIIRMSEMQSLQIGKIVDKEFNGHIVMRTYSCRHFEVVDLTMRQSFWDRASDILVELLPPGTVIQITI